MAIKTVVAEARVKPQPTVYQKNSGDRDGCSESEHTVQMHRRTDKSVCKHAALVVEKDAVEAAEYRAWKNNFKNTFKCAKGSTSGRDERGRPRRASNGSVSGLVNVRTEEKLICRVLRERSGQKSWHAVALANCEELAMTIIETTATKAATVRGKLDCACPRSTSVTQLVDAV